MLFYFGEFSRGVSGADLKQSLSIQQILTFRRCKCATNVPTAVNTLRTKAVADTTSILFS